MYFYKGWIISYGANRPITGAWKAEKHGVEWMVDLKEKSTAHPFG